MHILVTNVDGITAPDLPALAQAMRICIVSILVPDHNWSGGVHVKKFERPLRIKEVQLVDGTTGLASDGAPSDCVALALLGYITPRIDLVVSGVNPMPNLGHDFTYSGTVTAAMEAVIRGVPGIAYSLDSIDNHLSLLDDQPACQVAEIVVKTMVCHNLPPWILLNVNIPNRSFEKIDGFQVTRQGLRVYRDRLDSRTDPRGHPYYWIGGDTPTGIHEDGTDVGALQDGFVSLTPLQLDLTAYPALQKLLRREWQPQPGEFR